MNIDQFPVSVTVDDQFDAGPFAASRARARTAYGLGTSGVNAFARAAVAATRFVQPVWPEYFTCTSNTWPAVGPRTPK